MKQRTIDRIMVVLAVFQILWGVTALLYIWVLR
jgi:hypothetical protein